MKYVADWTLRDYAEQTRNHKLVSPVVLVGRAGPGVPIESVSFSRAHGLDTTIDPGVVLLVEQENGSVETVFVTREI